MCLSGRVHTTHFAPTALAFEIFVGMGLGAQVLDWQNLIGEHGWTLGGVPAVGVWVVFFANIVPLQPGLHLLGAVASSLSLPVFFFFSLSFYSVPSWIGPEQNLMVFGQLMIPTVLAVLVAYVSARRVYGLSMDLSEARRLGRYRLTEKLGEGGMGEVWRAEHDFLARPAAVKLIRAGGALPTDMLLERFEREVQSTAELRSPHTIQVYDYGRTEDGTFYYVMELLDGIDLEKLVQQHGPLPVERVLHVLRQACHSLGEAHELGLVHRDIKPANLYLCRYGRDVDHVKVLDFGMVKQVVEGPSGLTQMGTFAGTASFAAPEVAQGLLDQVDGRADIYALGCIAFWLLTEKMVFEGETTMKVLVKHIHDDPPPPSRFAEAVPAELDRLVLDCLAKEREDRIGSTDELARRLAEIPCSSPWTNERAGAWWDYHKPGRIG
jgi:serine/threonine-protein kinase